MKLLLKLVGTLVVLALIAVFVGALYLDRVVKTSVETVAPEFTKSRVVLDGVSLSLLNGSASLSGLQIGNPGGFSAPNAFSLQSVDVKLNRDSIFTDTIIVDSVRILAPEVTYESLGKGSNIEALQRNVEQAIASAGGVSSETASQAPGKKLIIKDLMVSKGQIHYSNALLGSKTLDLPLPDIHLTGIGEKSGGASASEVAGQILSALNKTAVQAVAQSGAIKDLGNRAKEKLGEKKDKLRGLLDGVKDKLKPESED